MKKEIKQDNKKPESETSKKIPIKKPDSDKKHTSREYVEGLNKK